MGRGWIRQQGDDTAPAFGRPGGAGLVGVPVPGIYIGIAIIHKRTSLRRIGSDRADARNTKCRMQSEKLGFIALLDVFWPASHYRVIARRLLPPWQSPGTNERNDYCKNRNISQQRAILWTFSASNLIPGDCHGPFDFAQGPRNDSGGRYQVAPISTER